MNGIREQDLFVTQSHVKEMSSIFTPHHRDVQFDMNELQSTTQSPHTFKIVMSRAWRRPEKAVIIARLLYILAHTDSRYMFSLLGTGLARDLSRIEKRMLINFFGDDGSMHKAVSTFA